jgi:hypothetical protein
VADLRVTSFLKAACLTAAFVALAPAAQAQSAGGAAAPRATSVVHIPGVSTFDWMAKKRVANGAVLVSSQDAPTTRQSRFFGRGSWICSPAGFGKKSSCFAR